MVTDRRFSRFNAGAAQAQARTGENDLTTHEIPEGGLCLSSFVLVTQAGKPDHVLLGRLNPDAPWDHIGALDSERVRVHSKGWMIPASHLMLKESPVDAARRVVKEQLEMESLTLSGPQVVSEVYTPRRFPDLPSHWDLEFIFRGELALEKVPKPSAWKELVFVDVSRTKKSEVARSHEDVLESAGFRLAD